MSKTQITSKQEVTQVKEVDYKALYEQAQAKIIALSTKTKVTKENASFIVLTEDITKAKLYKNCDMIEKLFEQSLENNEKAQAIFKNKLTRNQAFDLIRVSLNSYVNSL